MLKITICLALASARALSTPSALAASFADSVVAYAPGTGFATDFGSGQGLTNAIAALGEPSRSTPGEFGGPVDPFNPPYLKEQLVSVGAGGSLVLGVNSPILNSPSHPFGLDFVIYGNSGFVITNGNFSGGGITDGSLFGANGGSARVSVSSDNVTYFTLDPTLAPDVDTRFPTDGSGSFDLPVDPGLTGNSFAAAGLAEIRALYAGSAGGAGYDLSWARDANGQRVTLPEVRFIRIDVLSGAAEIDAVSVLGVVPEPGSILLLGVGLAAAFVWRSCRAKLGVCRTC